MGLREERDFSSPSFFTKAVYILSTHLFRVMVTNRMSYAGTIGDEGMHRLGRRAATLICCTSMKKSRKPLFRLEQSESQSLSQIACTLTYAHAYSNSSLLSFLFLIVSRSSLSSDNNYCPSSHATPDPACLSYQSLVPTSQRSLGVTGDYSQRSGRPFYN